MVDLIMLVGASLGSVAFSILAAYGILRVGFALMRPQCRATAGSVRQQVVRAS